MALGNLRFIDLFAGLGGFHLALKELGGECVFVSEIDPNLKDLYQRNFGMKPHGDIQQIDPHDVNDHEILCAGFPCQPFSKAGKQEGLNCSERGTLIDNIIGILKAKQPRYFILENVPNFLKQNGGATWGNVQDRLKSAGYATKGVTLSPHEFGVPHNRVRAFIVGVRDDLPNDFDAFEEDLDKQKEPNTAVPDINTVLDKKPEEAKPLTEQTLKYLNAWQEFLNLFPPDEQFPLFPIWAMEFGADYPYEDTTPEHIGLDKLGSYKGKFGESLDLTDTEDVRNALPVYARERTEQFPGWKIGYIQKNRKLYKQHKRQIDRWLPRIKGFPPSFQKFEWNCGDTPDRDLWGKLIQCRSSGVRAKLPTTSPSLVAIASNNIPIVGWEERYMTVRECSRLQSMEGLRGLPSEDAVAYKALGNAVNVKVVRAVASSLLESMDTAGARVAAAQMVA